MNTFGWLIVCLVAADLISGIGHWWEDRYGDPDWPMLGKHIVQPNIQHHLTPLQITEGGYWQRNWTTIMPALIVAAMSWPWITAWQWYVTLAIASQANQVHAWSHQKTSGIVRLLQDCGILISHKAHAIHHHAPFDCYFCVMTPFLNPALERLGFWRLLEMMIHIFTGILPRAARYQA